MGSLITVHPQVVEGISPKTMERAIARRARLNPAASDRLHRTARIIALQRHAPGWR